MAIILAWRSTSPALRMLGASTSAGNQTLAKTSRNFQLVAQLIGETVRCHPGASAPLMRQEVGCPDIHGECGLGGGVWPSSEDLLEPDRSVPAIAAMAASMNGYHAESGGDRAVLVCTGPLTNAALLIKVYPEIADKIEIVFMGGSVGAAPLAGHAEMEGAMREAKHNVHGRVDCSGAVAALGNTGVAAEFNIQVDPEAAKIVMDSSVPKTMVPLQVTHSAIITESVREALYAAAEDGERNGASSHYRECIAGLLDFFRESYSSHFGFSDGPPLHDPCAIAYVLCPEMFVTRKMAVDIETKSEMLAGMTVCDTLGVTRRAPNCSVAVSMDVQRFWAMMENAVRGGGKSEADDGLPHDKL